MNIRPLLKAALTLIGATFVAAGVAAVWPMPGARAMTAQAEVVQARMGPIVRKVGSPLQILVTRDSVLSVLMYDRVFPWFNGENHGETRRVARSASAKAMGHLHSEDVAQAVHPSLLGKCLVVVSAQGMGIGSPLHGLADEIGNPELAWRFILTHEAAHCLRNAALDIRMSQAVVKDGLTMFAADFLTEAYADNFAFADLWSQNRGRATEMLPGLLRWRGGAQMAPPWKTGPAIELLVSRLAGTAISDAVHDAVLLDPVLFDRMAWQAAVDALPSHFERMGLDIRRVDLHLISNIGQKTPLSTAEKTP